MPNYLKKLLVLLSGSDSETGDFRYYTRGRGRFTVEGARKLPERTCPDPLSS